MPSNGHGPTTEAIREACREAWAFSSYPSRSSHEARVYMVQEKLGVSGERASTWLEEFSGTRPNPDSAAPDVEPSEHIRDPEPQVLLSTTTAEALQAAPTSWTWDRRIAAGPRTISLAAPLEVVASPDQYFDPSGFVPARLGAELDAVGH